MAAATTKKKTDDGSMRSAFAAVASFARGVKLTGQIIGIWREAIPLPILAAAALLPSSGVVRLLAAAILLILVTSPAYWRGPIGKNVHDTWHLKLKRSWKADCDILKISAVIKDKPSYPAVKIKVGPMTGWSELWEAIGALRPRDALKPWRIRLPLRDAMKPDWLQYQITPLPVQYEEKLRSHLEEGLRRLRKYKDVDSAAAGDDWIIMLVMAELEDRVEFSMGSRADLEIVEQIYALPTAGDEEETAA